MRTSSLFDAKNFRFFEIYGVYPRTRGKGELSQCGHFADKEGGGQFFAILCGRPLWTAQNIFQFYTIKHCTICGRFNSWRQADLIGATEQWGVWGANPPRRWYEKYLRGLH